MLTLFFQASWDYFKLEEARTSVQSPVLSWCSCLDNMGILWVTL